MSAETQVDRSTGTRTGIVPWQGGVIGGLVGALLFGVLASIMTPAFLENAVPALFGLETPAPILGWFIHMSIGAIFGVLFVAIVELGGVDPELDTNLWNGIAGLLYGLAVWLVFAVFVMPFWLDAVGFAGAPAMPNITTESFLGHALYGVGLGITYSVLSD